MALLLYLGTFLVKPISVLVALVIVLLTYVKWKHNYWTRKNLPFIPPTVPFGNLENPAKRTRSLGLHIKELYDTAKRKGLKHCGIYFFASPIYMVVDLEYMKNVLIKDFSHFVDRGMYYNEKVDPISAHLFAIGGKKWKELRAKLTPTFTSGKIKTMFPILQECISLLLDAVEQNHNCIDIKELAGRFTTDVIGSCAFGLDCNSFRDENSPFRVYGKKVFYSSRKRNFMLSLVSAFPHLGRILKVRQVSQEVSDFFTKTVKDTIEYREKNKISRPDFLQSLIDMKNEENGYTITLDEIVAQCFIFFLGGLETSSTTMAFALYELAKNPEIQEKLREEIETTFKKHGSINYKAIKEMKYLDQVVNETLRMYPPFPFVTRTCVQDYKVPGEDVIIKKGRRVLIPILGIQCDEEYFPSPEVFDPDRFGDQNANVPYTFIPFGEGPRTCIGMSFGLLETKMGVAALLKNYKFTVNSKTSNPIKLSLRTFVTSAEGGTWLDAHKL